MNTFKCYASLYDMSSFLNGATWITSLKLTNQNIGMTFTTNWVMASWKAGGEYTQHACQALCAETTHLNGYVIKPIHMDSGNSCGATTHARWSHPLCWVTPWVKWHISVHCAVNANRQVDKNKAHECLSHFHCMSRPFELNWIKNIHLGSSVF